MFAKEKLVDKIGREEIRDRICAIVDNLVSGGNLCVALDGNWGSGKTFVLGLVEEQLKNNPEYIIVKYDAWANSFYSDPLIAILTCIVDSINDKLKQIRGYKKTLKEVATSETLKILDTLSNQPGKIGFISKVAKKFIELIPKFQGSLIKNNKIDDFKSYQQLLIEVKDALNTLTEYKDYLNRQSKLIILVDEIDRCLPNEQLKILERLHHLFDVKNCVVVCAITKNTVSKTIETIYGVNGYEYLRKFFDKTISLPVAAPIFLSNLLKDFSQKLINENKTLKWIEEPLLYGYQCLYYGELKVLEKVDNREIFRYFNSIVSIFEEFGYEKLTVEYVFFIVLSLFIKLFVNKNFLDNNEIKDNQELIDESIQSYDSNERRNIMPYHDYLLENIGIDRTGLPNEIPRFNYYTKIPELSWYFNEIVCYSVKDKFFNNSMRAFMHQPQVHTDHCKMLRDLVLKYGEN